jgi:SOS-response transcriptional repressor LexA
VKRYRSERTTDEGGWRHARITLEPINPEFEPIVLTADEEDSVTVIAELIEVIDSAAPE